MGRTVMSTRTVQLKGLDMFVYFMKHFKMTPEEALKEMKEHNQDTTEVERVIKDAVEWVEANEQKGE